MNIRFGIAFEKAKTLFFDRGYVKSLIDETALHKLSRFGAYVRQKARDLIRTPGKGGAASKPGQPPKNRVGQLRNFILFSYEPADRAVIIGPTKLNQKIGNAPEALEYGGESVSAVGPRGKRRKIAVQIEARPYMHPAFDIELAKVPDDWRDSIIG